MQSIAGGDRQAFAVFVGRHAAPVLRLTRLWTASEADAEDATQQAFLSLWKSAGTFSGDGSPRSFLLSIARRAALRTHRRHAGEPTQHESIEALGEAAGWGSLGDDLEARLANRDRVLRALARLSEADREVLELRDLSGLTNQELADTCGISLTQAKGRLHRARLRLLAELEHDDEG